MLSFIFGGDQEAKTPQQLARMRQLADALAEANGRAPQNVGEGLQAIGNAIAYRQMMSRVQAGEASGRTSGNAAFNNIAAAMAGQSAFPPAPGGAAAGTGDALNPTPTAHAAERERDPSIAGLEIKGGIEETAKALGIDPVDLATAISYETGGTFDPTKRGPTTQWGQHRGLIQFGEPQAQKYGVDWNDPVKSQLGADGAVAKYLRDTGVKPGMGMLDIYSAINAGGVGRYDASDANNGGAPGTVRDKVGRQMAGHRAKAMAMFGGGSVAQPAPVQVASLDPSAGVAQATNVPPMPEEYAKTGLSPEAWAKMNAPDQPEAPQPAPQPVQAPVPQPRQQVAQAIMDQTPVMAGGNSGAITRDAQGGPSLQMLMETAGNPWLTEGQGSIVNALMEQQMKANDPAYKLGLEKTQIELDNLRNPRISPADKARLDMDKAKFDAEQKNTAADDQREAARLKLEQDKYTTDSSLAREKFDWEKDKDRLPEFYDAYVQQERAAGREPLGILDYVTTSKKAGASTVNVNSGEPADGELRKALDKKTGEVWAGYQESGATSASMSQDMEVLDELIKVAPQGPVTGRLAELFPGVSSAGDAFQSIVKRVAPTLRAPGSGATSDIEYDGMLKSLPALRNKPEANAMVSQIMKAKAAINIERSGVIDAYGRGEITAGDARDRIAEINKRSIMTPDMQKSLATLSGDQPGGAPAQPQSDDEYNALPPGALFVDPDDGKTYRKP